MEPTIKFKPGHLLSSSSPIAHSLDNCLKRRCCDFCFKSGFQLMECENCKRMYYCNKICKKNDRYIHKLECETYRKSYNDLTDVFHRNLWRLYLLAKNIPSFMKDKEELKFDEQVSRSFDDLVTLEDEILHDFDKMNKFIDIVRIFKKCQLEFDNNLLFKLYCKMCVNISVVFDWNNQQIGTGLYLAESILNHSCIPNAGVTFNGTKIRITAIKDIAVGEKITINYCNLEIPTSVRKSEIKKRFYFDCNCQRCQENDEDFEKVLKEIAISEFIFIHSDSLKLPLAISLMQNYQKIYGKFHPRLSLHLFKIAYLILYDQLYDSVLSSFFKEVHDSIKLTHGTDHCLYKSFTGLVVDSIKKHYQLEILTQTLTHLFGTEFNL